MTEDTQIEIKNYLPVSQELVDQSADKKEKETGIFHWKTKNNSYVPVTEMLDYEIRQAIEFSESRMESLQRQIRERHEEMHHWQHRIDKLREGLEAKEENSNEVSEEAVTQQKELTEA